MECLNYPFDSELLIQKKKKIRRELLESGTPFIEKRIAVLGGSTTSDVISLLELFLLQEGIRPAFYESQYNQFYQDAVWGNAELDSFAPDIIYIHTSARNIRRYPKMSDSEEMIEELEEETYTMFSQAWKALRKKFHCPIIQNNFEYPLYRLLGNKDSVDVHGKTRFVLRLNERFATYAAGHEDFFIHDIHYLSSLYGLAAWNDPLYWHMYKYLCAVPALPDFAFSLSKIIKSVFGRNKKGLVLDLDNTLWGGVVGDDGVEGIQIGEETSMGQVYSEFQRFLKEYTEIGILLAVNSKNDESNALAGLNHPEGALRPEDFVEIKANWEPKDQNFEEIANAINLLPESLVFVDDNPAERAIVKGRFPQVATPPLAQVQDYAALIDRSGFFEVTYFSKDDQKRNEMYRENVQRNRLQASVKSYSEYLLSLEMRAQIASFKQMYYERIAQLSNKSNQFNLTTRRYSQANIEQLANDDSYITLYGKLEDRFGENGVVSVVIGEIKEVKASGDFIASVAEEGKRELHIDLWIMSCRVLKRDMEYAMMDALVAACKEKQIKTIYGYYYPTAKNAMVCDFYGTLGFEKCKEEDGNSLWSFAVTEDYTNKNYAITVEKDGE